jgi:hypothetical protein
MKAREYSSRNGVALEDGPLDSPKMARSPCFDVTTSLTMSPSPVATLALPGGRSQYSSQVRYFTISSSSTSKTSVAPGLIVGGDPRRP